MKRISLGGYLAIAVGITVFVTGLMVIVPSLKLLAIAITAIFCMVHLVLSPPKYGRIVLVMSVGVLLAILFGWSSACSALIVGAGIMWMVRSLCSYSGVVPATLDLGLTVVALTAAFGVIGYSHSAILAVWTFLFISSLAGLIPTSFSSKSRVEAKLSENETKFERAAKVAEAALMRIAK